MKTLILDTTTKKLQMVMSGPPATTNPVYVVTFADKTSSALTEGNLNGTLSGTGTVDIVPAPAASAIRDVPEIVVKNVDTSPVVIYFQLNDNGTVRPIKTISLASGETWEMSTQTAIDGAPGADATPSDYLADLVTTEVSITGTGTAYWGKQHVVTGSTNFSIAIEACAGHAGEFMSFRILNTGITTLDGNSSETIDGVATRTYREGQTVTLYCDGTNAHSLNHLGAIRTQFVLITQCTFSGTMAELFNAAQKMGFVLYQSSPANGDYLEFAVWLNKGTYTCKVHGSSGQNFGKLDWTLNGVSQTTGQDWHSGAGINVWNVDKTFSVTVPYTGYHVMRGTINGKNASSGGYYYGLTAFVFYPSAY